MVATLVKHGARKTHDRDATILFADWRDTHDLGLMMLLGRSCGDDFGVLAERIDFAHGQPSGGF